MFITGAGSGLGLLSTKKALAEGWRVAAVDINLEGLGQLGDSPDLLALPCDITDEEAVTAAVSRCEAELGPIFRLVNAAAIMPLAEILDQGPHLINKIMAINYGGLVNVSQAALPLMLERGQGEFVSYASMAGHWPIIYMGAYNASKHAVAAYTEVLFHETRNSGVRIVCVCPPIVATPLLDQARSCWPKLFDVFPPLKPEVVLKAIERKLKGKGLWVFPGPLTPMTYRLRRWFPQTLWGAVHILEKR
ncbi:SDR family oxidoreductase [Spongiibacter taiwanensis]|uniref:SDR family NAD(P)-dependent oxidoreductase n=1 Tax=Spongiibacter taiwanensis TaxID=1748242 RepID=UPI002034E62A|nr:SDR family oxidoreductase [Spongiibacter taiwanensis]USA42630.1 SDR family oxidoreductase [Spongiibacter taiwanensis]